MPPVSPSTTIRRPYHRLIKVDSLLLSHRPDERLRAARDHAKDRRTRRALAARVDTLDDWPDYSPGALNAWLLLVTTKPPNWRDSMVNWPEGALTLGEPHEGFFYPDPLGFWAELRRWTVELFRTRQPTWGSPEALTLTTILHMADDAGRLRKAVALSEPRVILFLDEPSWERSGREAPHREPHFIADPHRANQVYEGFWARTDDDVIIGKAPQHPSMHNLYRENDMLGFVRSAPQPTA